jgi:hypothetical protein
LSQRQVLALKMNEQRSCRSPAASEWSFGACGSIFLFFFFFFFFFVASFLSIRHLFLSATRWTGSSPLGTQYASLSSSKYA